jgi:hypothetical protein
MEHFEAAAQQFATMGTIKRISPFGNGNINKTYLVETDALKPRFFVLQKINVEVFQQPHLVMKNIGVYSQHVQNRLDERPLIGERRWEVPRVLLTSTGKDHWMAPNGGFWRALSFIENCDVFDALSSTTQAEEVGYALGLFHDLISDLPAEQMEDTLHGFHIAPAYLDVYDHILPNSTVAQTTEVKWAMRFIEERRALAAILEDAKEQGVLKMRLMHGDPKVNNFMVDKTTGRVISIVDLDTVKPGLIHYDIGDCLRSGCNRLGEDAEDPEKVEFDPDLSQAILRGYLSAGNTFLTENDYNFIYDSLRLIAFELGLRFFADHMNGDKYFGIKYPGHNLHRALVQFRLAASVEAQEAALRALIWDMRWQK